MRGSDIDKIFDDWVREVIECRNAAVEAQLLQNNMVVCRNPNGGHSIYRVPDWHKMPFRRLRVEWRRWRLRRMA